jgi:uncharacterized protein (DUF4415 family)
MAFTYELKDAKKQAEAKNFAQKNRENPAPKPGQIVPTEEKSGGFKLPDDFPALEEVAVTLPEAMAAEPEAVKIRKQKKEMITIRLSPEVIDWFRGTGHGWQPRLNQVLVDYVREKKS